MSYLKQIMVLVIMGLCQFSTAQNSQLDSLLQQIKEKYSVVGMSVTVTKESDIVFSQGYGLRDIGRNLPVDQNTIYRIASISKMITATALMQLYEKNLFSLDDDVSDYLDFELKNPTFPDQDITFRQVLSHTSSLRDGSGYNAFLNASYNNTPPPKISELLTPGGTYYTSDMYSNSRAPNSNYFQYANINFGVVATLIERISGQRFDLYCKEHIFDPLQIDGSFNVQHLTDINDVAVLYRKSGNSWVPQADHYQGSYPPPRDLSGYTIGDNGILFSPQGGLRISAAHLARLMLMHLQGGVYGQTRLLNDTTVTRMHEIVWNYAGNNGNNYYGIFNTYALGNSTTQDLLPGETLTGHPGEAYGLISDMYFSKENRFGIIFITNGGLWSTGTYSGWYNIEEEVFQACYAELPNLTALSALDQTRPMVFMLSQCYPNPFNPVTTIRYAIGAHHDAPVWIDLSIYNLLGQKVATLISAKQPAGHYEVQWDASGMASGVYLYKLSTDQGFSQTRKLVLLR